jgi:hypothetical protein
MHSVVAPHRLGQHDLMSAAREGSPSNPLVEALAGQLRRVDLVAWQRIASWAEQFELSFENLRVLLALRVEGGPAAVSELAELGGLSVEQLCDDLLQRVVPGPADDDVALLAVRCRPDGTDLVR